MYKHGSRARLMRKHISTMAEHLSQNIECDTHLANTDVVNVFGRQFGCGLYVSDDRDGRLGAYLYDFTLHNFMLTTMTSRVQYI